MVLSPKLVDLPFNPNPTADMNDAQAAFVRATNFVKPLGVPQTWNNMEIEAMEMKKMEDVHK